MSDSIGSQALWKHSLDPDPDHRDSIAIGKLDQFAMVVMRP
jgi:hypothetical protein